MNLLGKRKSGPTTASSVEVRGKIIIESSPAALDLRTRTSTRFNLKFLRVLKKKKKKRHPEKLRFTFFWLKKLIRLFILKEVKLSPDSKMRKLLTFDNLFPPLRHSR